MRKAGDCVSTGFAARVSPTHSRVDLAPKASTANHEASGDANNEWIDYIFASRLASPLARMCKPGLKRISGIIPLVCLERNEVVILASYLTICLLK